MGLDKRCNEIHLLLNVLRNYTNLFVVYSVDQRRSYARKKITVQSDPEILTWNTLASLNYTEKTSLSKGICISLFLVLNICIALVVGVGLPEGST